MSTHSVCTKKGRDKQIPLLYQIRYNIELLFFLIVDLICNLITEFCCFCTEKAVFLP
jgi:hypothetical protein